MSLSAVFSPDGKRIVSGSWDHTLKVYDLSTRQVIFTFSGHTGGVCSVAFSPDGRYVVSGSADQTVKLWDTTTGREALTLKGHSGSVNSVAFSPEGKYIASGSSDGTVKLWDLARWEEKVFDTALNFTLKWEGGFVDDPVDPGGRTNKGITQSTYNNYRKTHGLGPSDVMGISDQEVREIYNGIWKTSGADRLPLPLAVAHFDTAVNFGTGRAQEWLQAVENGKQTPMDAAKAYAQKRIEYRYERVKQDPSQQKFLRGWLNRDNALIAEINSLGNVPN